MTINQELAREAVRTTRLELYPSGQNNKEPRGETACCLLESLEIAEKQIPPQYGEYTAPPSNHQRERNRKSPDLAVLEIRRLAAMRHPSK